MRGEHFAVTLTLVLLGGAGAVRADCFGRGPISSFPLFSDHATVPTNFVAFIEPILVATNAPGSWFLRQVGQQQLLETNVAFDADFVRITPKQELAGDTDFEALSFDAADAPDNPDQAAVHIIPFHTSGHDETAPGKPVITHTGSTTINGPLECSSRSRNDFTIFVSADPDVAAFETIEHVDGADLVVDARRPVVDPGNIVALGGFTGGGSGWTSFTVDALDQAGNKSSTDTTIFLNPVGCASATGEPAVLALVVFALVTRGRRGSAAIRRRALRTSS